MLIETIQTTAAAALPVEAAVEVPAAVAEAVEGIKERHYSHLKLILMDKKIAILATHGFEESELKSPKETLEQQGWTVRPSLL